MRLFHRAKKKVSTNETDMLRVEESADMKMAHDDERAQFRGSAGVLGHVHPDLDSSLQEDQSRASANLESDTNKELFIEHERRAEEGYER